MRHLWVLIAVMGCGDKGIGENERAWLLTMRPVWTAAARAERCPRPALRTPTTGDGSARLGVLIDKSSPEQRCLVTVRGMRTELGPCMPKEHCGPQTLATLAPHPDVVEACAPLYATIEELAHTTEACSPTSAASSYDDENMVNFYSLGNAVRLEVAPLVARGQLGDAASRVLDAIRFADDFGRKSGILASALSLAAEFRLIDTLDEIAIDPRLTADDAHAIARDLDVLLASAPRWDAIMRQEQVWVANFAYSNHEDVVPVLAILEASARGIRRVCRGALRDCVEHLDDVKVEGAADFKVYAQRLAVRDSDLAFLRMQIELRLSRPADCTDPGRRRALLQPWADRAIVGDECEPVVTPPLWQRSSELPARAVPHVLRCVSAVH